MRMLKGLSLSLIPLLWTAAVWPAQPSFDGEDHPQILQEMGTLAPDDLAQKLVNSDPGTYYLYVQSLWNSGKKDDAVMWLYVAKLRSRFHLLAHPDLDPSGDPARLTAVDHDFSPPVAEHAAQDPNTWAGQIAAALDWDASHDNGFTSKADFKQALDRVRGDMTKFHDYVLGNQASLKAEAKITGIGNTDFIDGVLIKDHRHKQPNYWPALAPQTTLDTLAGAYQEAASGPTGRLFFGDAPKEYTKLHRATVYELSKQDDASLLVVAKADGKEVDRRVIPVKLVGDAVTFEEDDTAKKVALASGNPSDTDTLTYFLRNDVSGELVIDMEYVMEGTYPGKKTHAKLLDSYWSVVKRAPSP